MIFICLALQLYGFVILARLLLSWFPIPTDGPLASVYSVIYTVTEPPLAAIRSVVPMVRLGTMGLDLSPLLLLVALSLVQRIICR